ncbi:MAG: type II CRISPR-associated endonuclease Cas1 [Bacteroidota bacterium]|jgi:CRISPR-associated protein Cas1
MIKKTLYFGNPMYLSCRNQQLVISVPHAKGIDHLLDHTVPIEDIGVVILDHKQITITQTLITQLLENNVAMITCDDSHLPKGLMLNLAGHTLQQTRFQAQLEATVPLKKNLWQQTVQAKIRNQAAILRRIGVGTENMMHWLHEVKSGDTENHEARAAAYYWKNFLPVTHQFTRQRDGIPPNNLLNYAYAIIRAVVARGLVASGLLPTFGIFHRNQYNAYCLADDVMEPFRPFADWMVREWVMSAKPYTELTKDIKKELLLLPTVDVLMEEKRSPLMVGLQRTTASLVACFEGTSRKIIYPEMP